MKYISHGTHNAFGQKVEYREYVREGDSPAERAVAVYVTDRKVAEGYASDGKTYAIYQKWLTGAMSAEDDPTVCMFHGHPYPEHDFYYGPECRRCGAEVED